MITNFTQRWTAEGKAVYRPQRAYFNPRHFEIETIDEATAKGFLRNRHYARTYPAARRRFGLFEKGRLVGVAVYSHPMSEKVITNVFHCERAADGLELGRLCLAEEVLSNGESFFVAECHRRLKREGFVGVVSFADDLPRLAADGSISFRGHCGFVYQSLNGAFLNRSSASKLYLLPDGTVFSARALSKIRAGEVGWQYAAKTLESFGASECPVEIKERRQWLAGWLGKITRRLNHPGNLRYAWSFSRQVRLVSSPYPKIRLDEKQLKLAF